MTRTMFLAMVLGSSWLVAETTEAKCVSNPTTNYRAAIELITKTLQEPGVGKWWRGEPQISWDFEIVNYNQFLAVQVRPAAGSWSLFEPSSATLYARACALETKPGDPPEILLSIDTSYYYGRWSDIYLSKVRSDLHVSWDGKVAVLKPTH